MSKIIVQNIKDLKKKVKTQLQKKQQRQNIRD